MNLEKFKTILTDRIAANQPTGNNAFIFSDDITSEEFNRFFEEQVFTLKMIAVVEVAKKLYKSGRFDNWDNAVADLAMAFDDLERE